MANGVRIFATWQLCAAASRSEPRVDFTYRFAAPVDNEAGRQVARPGLERGGDRKRGTPFICLNAVACIEVDQAIDLVDL
jgi:hypothetical protein